MFRKTLITATIAAAAFLALGSPAPASANDFVCLFSPLGCDHRGLLDLGETTGTTDAAGDTFVMPVLSPEVLAALTEPSIDIPEAALPNFDLPESIVPGPTDETPAEEPVAPVAETTTTTAAPVAEEPVVEAESFSTEEAHVAPTTTMTTGEVTDENPDVQVAEAIAAPETDQSGSFDPMMAALFGALGSLAIMLLTLPAFAAGRRSN